MRVVVCFHLVLAQGEMDGRKLADGKVRLDTNARKEAVGGDDFEEGESERADNGILVKYGLGRIGDASQGTIMASSNTTANESQTDSDRKSLSTSSKPS